MLDLEAVAHDPFDGVLEIVPDQGGNGVVAIATSERSAHRGLTYRFNVRRRKPSQTLGHAVNPDVELDVLQVHPEEPFAVRLARRGDLDLLREPSASHDCGIDSIEVVRGANQENIVFGFELADLGPALFHHLRVVRAQQPCVRGQKAINLVEEEGLFSLALAKISESFLTDAPTCPPRISAALSG